jgi:hypothetical protein
MTKLTTLLLGAGAAASAFLTYRAGSAKYKGDLARVGDQAWYSLADLNSTMPGALPAALQAAVGYVVQRVDAVGPFVAGTSSPTLSGPLVAYALQDNVVVPLPTPVGPVQLPGYMVQNLLRDGKAVS